MSEQHTCPSCGHSWQHRLWWRGDTCRVCQRTGKPATGVMLWIAKICDRRGWGLKQLGRRAGLHKHTLPEIFRDGRRPHMGTLARIAWADIAEGSLIASRRAQSARSNA